ncbi:MFS transporter [Paenibacillus sp. sptzw28]|uniref:MFS transporter n=1 Tax=Paenibacillus sp. sptzw28 TaxID=715179 RepID=UPI001C6E49AA|nr:MFS transporter [Paenibacillus sp. sptzw28]QYR20438.1 MFS transporter [Paenibacillus sp. sptzw28]
MLAGIKTFFSNLKIQLGPRAWHNFCYDAGASVLFSFFNVVFNQFYIPMAIREGATNMQVGLLSAAPAIGLLFSPLWAAWIERSNPKLFMIVPNLIGRALILLPAFFGAPVVYVAVALVFQLLMGVQAPAYASLIIRMYPQEHRGKLMGNVRVIMGVLMIPFAYVVGRWTDAAGPAGPLIFASAAGVLSILVFIKVRAKKTAPAKLTAVRRASFKDQLQLVKNNPELGIFFLACTLAGFGNILAGPLYQIIQVDRLELSNVQIGIARVTYYACLLTAYLIVGFVIDRLSAKHTIIFGFGAFAIVPLLYAIMGNFPAVLIGSGIQGVGDAIWDIGILAYVFRLAPGREAVVFGLHLMLFGVRGTIAPLLSTYLSGSLPMPSLLLGASLFGWAGLLIFVLHWKGRQQPQQPAPGS